jgi:ribulose 1,5-bisphosphate synthetase/thiazole synthase
MVLPSSNITSAAPVPYFDDIVIGTGLSGLTAAAFLSKGGARVLVCKQVATISGLYHSHGGSPVAVLTGKLAAEYALQNISVA